MNADETAAQGRSDVRVEEELTEAEGFAYLLADVPELATLLMKSEGEIRTAVESESDPLGQHIRRGWLRRKLEFRESVFKLSEQGSGPAQTLVMQFIQRMDL